jgi:hypothetical protein
VVCGRRFLVNGLWSRRPTSGYPRRAPRRMSFMSSPWCLRRRWSRLGALRPRHVKMRPRLERRRPKPTAPRGGTLGLLHGCSLEETSNLITGPLGLGCRCLGHVAEKHGRDNNVLAGSIEDWGFTHLVLDDATIDITSSLSSPSATCACHALPHEGLLQ